MLSLRRKLLYPKFKLLINALTGQVGSGTRVARNQLDQEWAELEVIPGFFIFGRQLEQLLLYGRLSSIGRCSRIVRPFSDRPH
jgi:hypothetical protein